MIYRHILIFAILTTLIMTPALAQPLNPLQEGIGDIANLGRFFAASLSFIAAALAAGLAISRAGSAGLAAAAERPEMRTTAIIITALGEAIAIYGIVVAILILGS
ncbi:MAG: ATP synthase subunit C [Nitrososphaerales archaeon]